MYSLPRFSDQEIIISDKIGISFQLFRVGEDLRSSRSSHGFRFGMDYRYSDNDGQEKPTEKMSEASRPCPHFEQLEVTIVSVTATTRRNLF